MGRRERVQPLKLSVGVVPEDQARELRHGQFETVRSRCIIRDSEQQQWSAARGFSDAFDGRDLLRLVLKGIEPVKITRDHLRWRGQGSEYKPGPQHA